MESQYFQDNLKLVGSGTLRVDNPPNLDIHLSIDGKTLWISAGLGYLLVVKNINPDTLNLIGLDAWEHKNA